MKRTVFLGLPLLLAACQATPTPEPSADALPRARVAGASVGNITLFEGRTVSNVPYGETWFDVEFTRAVDPAQYDAAAVSFPSALQAASGKDATVLRLTPTAPLAPNTEYTLTLSAGAQCGVDLVEPVTYTFVTTYDSSDKFPRIPTEDLLTLVQQKTFGYFWDHAHPVSGLARERLGSGNTVTTGGSGFGLMTLPVAVERGFVTRSEAADRLRTIVTFLSEKADRFHGAFPHWLNGETGRVIPFSSNDNGADLVETAFLMQGLLTAGQYFDAPEETDITAGIDALWKAVEWDWFTRGGNVLYWHWSPDKEWAMNMPIRGWNEGLIVYVLAASSPTHPVDRTVYEQGWAASARNGRTFYDTVLPLGPDLGGPLFFAHYSFLGLDPRNLSDAFCDSYWAQNVAHARINQAYCAANPKGHAGYGASCWGLTASDYPGGYTASSPTHDTGTIAPTAALASMPYTSEESLAALETFYYVYGDKLWGEYGFKDAFNLDRSWFASSYIAIDQGPIVVMIENYRSALLWDLFMRCPDVKAGLEKLGFSF